MVGTFHFTINDNEGDFETAPGAKPSSPVRRHVTDRSRATVPGAGRFQVLRVSPDGTLGFLPVPYPQPETDRRVSELQLARQCYVGTEVNTQRAAGAPRSLVCEPLCQWPLPLLNSFSSPSGPVFANTWRTRTRLSAARSRRHSTG